MGRAVDRAPWGPGTQGVPTAGAPYGAHLLFGSSKTVTSASVRQNRGLGQFLMLVQDKEQLGNAVKAASFIHQVQQGPSPLSPHSRRDGAQGPL